MSVCVASREHVLPEAHTALAREGHRRAVLCNRQLVHDFQLAVGLKGLNSLLGPRTEPTVAVDVVDTASRHTHTHTRTWIASWTCLTALMWAHSTVEIATRML